MKRKKVARAQGGCRASEKKYLDGDLNPILT
jgi:hypothetical protein